MKEIDIKKEVLSEFRSIYKIEKEKKQPKINAKTNAVVVFSGHGIYDEKGKTITWISPENIVRIGYGIEVAKKVLSIRLNKETITSRDIINSGLKLFLSGESNKQEDINRNQLDDMKRIAQDYNFPAENIHLQDCLINGQGNTKTQIETINKDPRMKNYTHITIVTSDYHVPRTERTALKNIRPKLKFHVLAAPQQEHEHYNVYPKVMGEIRRIAKYAKQGDLSPSLDKS